MDIREQFGRAVREMRTAQGLTQEELAFRAGMNVTYLSDLERGRWNPSLAMIVDLASGLDVHPSQLLKDIVVNPEAPPSGRKRPKD